MLEIGMTRHRGVENRDGTFLENQKAGYAHLFDAKTGTFVFGWDATRTVCLAGKTPPAKYIVGHMIIW